MRTLDQAPTEKLIDIRLITGFFSKGTVKAKAKENAIVVFYSENKERLIPLNTEYREIKTPKQQVSEQIAEKWRRQSLDCAHDSIDNVTTDFIINLLASGWTPDVSD